MTLAILVPSGGDLASGITQENGRSFEFTEVTSAPPGWITDVGTEERARLLRMKGSVLNARLDWVESE